MQVNSVPPVTASQQQQTPSAPPAAVAKCQAAAQVLLQNLPSDYTKAERGYATDILEKVKKRKDANTFHVVASGVSFDRQKDILKHLKEAFFDCGFAGSQTVIKVDENDQPTPFSPKPSSWMFAQTAAPAPKQTSAPIAQATIPAKPAPAAAPSPQASIPAQPAAAPAPQPQPDLSRELQDRLYEKLKGVRYPENFSQEQKNRAKDIVTYHQYKIGEAFGYEKLNGYIPNTDERTALLNFLVDQELIAAYGMGRSYIIKLTPDDQLPKDFIPPSSWVDKAKRDQILRYQNANHINLSIIWSEEFLRQKFPSEEEQKELKSLVLILNRRTENRPEPILYKPVLKKILQFFLEQQLIGGFEETLDAAGNPRGFLVHPMK